MKLLLNDIKLQQGDFLLEIDLEVTGQVIGLLGPSGAGKTSLLEVIAGLRRATSAIVIADNVILSDHRRKLFLPPEQRGVGYVPQDLALFDHLSVRGNLAYGYKAVSPNPAIKLAHVAQVLEIEELLDRPTAQLSGGQKQRVAFARALLASPRLLLMDEPLASLDQELKLRIIPYLQRIRDEFGVPMIYVSHSPDEMVALCDQIIVMRNGQCLRVSPPGELFESTTAMTLRPGILV